jgi:AmmeMemoRadiSam system protein B
MFYPDDPEQCRETARRYLQSAPRRDPAEGRGGSAWLGGIVPHAGWICSAAIAAETIASIARSGAEAGGTRPIDVVVVFGAVHTPAPLEQAVLDSFARWQVPGDASRVAAELRERVRGSSGELFRVDDRFHLREHAVEVELPLIQQALPNAAILPVEVPLIDRAIEIGRAAARQVLDAKLGAVFLASSDLTHYGPAYRFAPAGVGPGGLNWAKNNDRRLLDLVENFRPEQVVEEVGEHANACGGGAIAAMMSACRELGASGATVLRHANSYETLADVAPQRPDNAVGYAAVVVG